MSPDPSAEPHVQATALGHHFHHGRAKVLDGVSLSVAKGEMVAVVGRSGCGKSTLLHILAGLLKPSHGEVRIGGQAVKGPSARYNMMFQAPSLFPWMSAADNVGLGLRYGGTDRKETRRRVNELLALVGLTEHGNDNVQQLSGGQQQRIALARSLATRPELLLLDEPFSALDPFNREALQGEVRQIARSLGLTLIIVTHDVDEAVTMADRVVVMAARPGRVVAELGIVLPSDRDRQHPDFLAARDEVHRHLGETSVPPQEAKPLRSGRSGWWAGLVGRTA
jgi:NitT/TauT family transport system ATP-binding protein